jgi:type II secretory pathway pseudopilin PulG
MRKANPMIKIARKTGIKKAEEGFSLIEALVGVALVAIAMLGLAQLFVLSIAQNSRAARITNATFLVQQRVEELRAFTADELNLLIGTPIDEILDLNQDTTDDFRRITRIQMAGDSYEIRVLVFGMEQQDVDVNDLLDDPVRYRVRSDVTTLLGR